MDMAKKRITSATPWESMFGYSRAIRVGNHVFVAGTTGTDSEGAPVGSGVADQTRAAISKIHAALGEAGAAMKDVVCVRAYVTNIDDWPEMSKPYMDAFSKIRPALTIVEVRRLFKPQILIEIEVEAVIEERKDDVFI
jgi:enamine deaminase RidA (YjgF/YER057c/UK114 family)